MSATVRVLALYVFGCTSFGAAVFFALDCVCK